METYDRNETTWRAHDGRDILVKDLELRHLVNILNWIKSNNEQAGKPAYDHALYEFLEGEAKYRAMLGFASNEGVPHKQEDGFWIVMNLSKEEEREQARETAFHKQALMRTIEEQRKAREERKKQLAEKAGWDEDDIL